MPTSTPVPDRAPPPALASPGRRALCGACRATLASDAPFCLACGALPGGLVHETSEADRATTARFARAAVLAAGAVSIVFVIEVALTYLSWVQSLDFLEWAGIETDDWTFSRSVARKLWAHTLAHGLGLVAAGVAWRLLERNRARAAAVVAGIGGTAVLLHGLALDIRSLFAVPLYAIGVGASIRLLRR